MLYAFDGTWSQDRLPHQWTNVCRLAKASHPGSVEYYPGVANPLEVKGVVAPKASYATAIEEVVDGALADFAGWWEQGHDIVDVVAFSRGAVAALIFLNQIRDWQRRDPRRQTLRLRFVGLFDAIDATGIEPHDWEFWFRRELPGGVERAVHAIAIHESRAHYRPLDVKGAHQQAFTGNHCDVGGGYSATGLSDITLEWMYREAERAGVPFHRTLAELGLRPDPAAVPHRAEDAKAVHRPRTMPEGTIMPARYRWPFLREEVAPKAKAAPHRRQPSNWTFIDEEYARLGPLDLDEDLVVIESEGEQPGTARIALIDPGRAAGAAG